MMIHRDDELQKSGTKTWMENWLLFDSVVASAQCRVDEIEDSTNQMLCELT